MKNITLALFIALLSRCAHQIQLTSPIDKFVESSNKLNHVVGYHISEQDRVKMVTTPGGGGDKVTYAPYKDTEIALYSVLANKFKDVYLVKSLNDSSFINEKEIKFVFIPKIITHSSSSSLFTWPPTSFTIELTTKAINSKGDTVWQTKVSETGKAEFSEFKSDFSLSARRATEQTFQKLAEQLETFNINEIKGK